MLASLLRFDNPIGKFAYECEDHGMPLSVLQLGASPGESSPYVAHKTDANIIGVILVTLIHVAETGSLVQDMLPCNHAQSIRILVQLYA